MNVTRWLSIPTIAAVLIATSGVARSQPTATITASSGNVSLAGESTSSNSCVGTVSGAPSHVVNVTEDSNLRFKVQSQGGQPTLLIQSSTGQKFCVQADNFSNGQVEIPGRWSKGTYSVYVGDRAKTEHPYTLLISRS